MGEYICTSEHTFHTGSYIEFFESFVNQTWQGSCDQLSGRICNQLDDGLTDKEHLEFN